MVQGDQQSYKILSDPFWSNQVSDITAQPGINGVKTCVTWLQRFKSAIWPKSPGQILRCFSLQELSSGTKDSLWMHVLFDCKNWVVNSVLRDNWSTRLPGILGDKVNMLNVSDWWSSHSDLFHPQSTITVYTAVTDLGFSTKCVRQLRVLQFNKWPRKVAPWNWTCQRKSTLQ